MTDEAPVVLKTDDSITFSVTGDFATMPHVRWSAEIIQTATDPNWIAEYLAYHGDGCPAYRDAFDFEAGYGAAA